MALWTPAHLPTALWLDGADAATLTLDASSRVSAWQDKSGNGRHATQPVAGKRPSYVHEMLWFNGSSQSLTVVNAAHLAKNIDRCSVFLVLYANSFSTQYQPVFHHATGTNSAQVRWGVFVTTGPEVGGRRQDSDSYQYLRDTASNALIVSGLFDYANAQLQMGVNGRYSARANGFQTAGKSSNTDSVATLLGYDTASSYFGGQIAEILVMPSIPAPMDCQIIEGYLAHKWGLAAALPVDHPYQGSPPTLNLARLASGVHLALAAAANLQRGVRLRGGAILSLSLAAPLQRRVRLTSNVRLALAATALLQRRVRLVSNARLALAFTTRRQPPTGRTTAFNSSALLDTLPGFFDRDPQADLALRVRHPAGLRWQIDRVDTLILSPAGWPETTIDLRAYTLAELVTHLRALGFEIPYSNPDLTARQASILTPGSGDQNSSNGDHLYGFRSILWAHLKALDLALADADHAMTALLRQLILPQARESWADYWGYHFGMPRLPGETDPAYTQRIIDEFYRARSNPVAMVKNVQRYTGAEIELFEPWTRMWTLSQSALSGGDDHFPSGDFYAYHWLQPISHNDHVDWPAILAVLNADRPAGTLLLGSATILPVIGIDTSQAQISIQSVGIHTRTRPLWVSDVGVLDVNLVLSAYENYLTFLSSGSEVLTRRIIPYWKQRTWETGGWDDDAWNVLTALPFPINPGRRSFCRGEIVLSEAPPLGDLQTHFPGRRWIEYGAPLALSEAGGLSDLNYGGYWQPIDEWESITYQIRLTETNGMIIEWETRESTLP